jgi:hypothetical protein
MIKKVVIIMFATAEGKINTMPATYGGSSAPIAATNWNHL